VITASFLGREPDLPLESTWWNVPLEPIYPPFEQRSRKMVQAPIGIAAVPPKKAYRCCAPESPRLVSQFIEDLRVYQRESGKDTQKC
jgi:hypothetical protein